MNERRGLWRGKRVGNGEWVEGYLRKAIDFYGKVQYSIITELNEHFIVDPETLGECIGRCDKNNNPIFEGDIVSTKYGRLCLVVWCSHSSFVGVDLDALEADHKAPSEYDLYDFLEIVGNCYDNPNLLTPNKT